MKACGPLSFSPAGKKNINNDVGVVMINSSPSPHPILWE
jgi:hypothetical protein